LPFNTTAYSSSRFLTFWWLGCLGSERVLKEQMHVKQIFPRSLSPSKLLIAAGGPVVRGKEGVNGETGCRTITERVQYDHPSFIGDTV